MNKKKDDPQFKYPFENTKDEKDRQMFDFIISEYISDKGSKVKLTQTSFSGGYRKIVLEETVYIKNTDAEKKLSDILHLKPQDQISREQYLVFDVSMDDKGAMRMVKKDNPKEFAEFNKNEAKVILHFYKLSNVVLEKAPKDLDFIYKNKDSLRMATIDINRKFSYGFKSLNKDEKKLISGNPRNNYSFNPYIRLNIISK